MAVAPLAHILAQFDALEPKQSGYHCLHCRFGLAGDLPEELPQLGLAEVNHHFLHRRIGRRSRQSLYAAKRRVSIGEKIGLADKQRKHRLDLSPLRELQRRRPCEENVVGPVAVIVAAEAAHWPNRAHRHYRHEDPRRRQALH